MKHLDKPLKILFLSVLFCLCLGIGALAAGLEIEVSFQPDNAMPSAEPSEVKEPEEASASALFTDLAYAENADELAAMIDKAYIAGYTDGSFRPGRSYTRLELAQLVTALCDLKADPTALPSFYDTEIFGSEAIDAAVSQGLMSGRSDTAFDPYGTVLKAELVGTLAKAAEMLGLDDFTIDEDWSADYSICTAAEAMHGAYLLDATLTEARDLALKEAAALLAAAETGDEIELDQGEAETDPAVTEDVEAPADFAEEAAEPAAANENASGEPSGEASGEPSGEASSEPSGEASEEPAEKPQTESSAPPAGVSTPAGQQSAAPAPAAPAPAAAAETETSVPDTEADAIRQQVFDIYESVKDSIVEFLKNIFS